MLGARVCACIHAHAYLYSLVWTNVCVQVFLRKKDLSWSVWDLRLGYVWGLWVICSCLHSRETMEETSSWHRLSGAPFIPQDSWLCLRGVPLGIQTTWIMHLMKSRQQLSYSMCVTFDLQPYLFAAVEDALSDQRVLSLIHSFFCLFCRCVSVLLPWYMAIDSLTWAASEWGEVIFKSGWSWWRNLTGLKGLLCCLSVKI